MTEKEEFDASMSAAKELEDKAQLLVGKVVTFVDSVSVEHDALVTAVWTGMAAEPGAKPGVNLIYVLDDVARTDQYGRQIDRSATSVVHKGNQPAPGMFWVEKK